MPAPPEQIDRSGSPKTLRALRAMSDEQLDYAIDHAGHSIGASVLMDELRRRDAERSERTMRRLTWAIAAMTLVILVATLVNVALFALSVTPQ